MSSTDQPDAEEAIDESNEPNDSSEDEGKEGSESSDEDEEVGDQDAKMLTTFENYAFGYEIESPSGWDLERNEDRQVAFADPDSDAELSIDIYLAEGNPSLKDGADMLIANTEMEDADVREREQTTLDSGDDAIALEIDYTQPERGELRSLLRVVAIDHVLYTAEFAAPLNEWEQREDLAQTVITSLTIPKPPSKSVTTDDLTDLKTYEGEDLSVEYPAEWDVDERDSGAVRIQSGKERAGMVVATEPSQKQPLKELVQAYRDEIELNPDAEIVDERDDLQVANGNDAHLLVADIDDPEGEATTFGLTTVGDGEVYYVTLEIPAVTHTFDAEEAIVEILTSLSF